MYKLSDCLLPAVPTRPDVLSATEALPNRFSKCSSRDQRDTWIFAYKNRRKKVFGDGRQTPVDRNDRARVMFLARTARKNGFITRAAVEILEALLFTFANLKDGRCFPGYERIALEAGCNPRTVGRCLPALEAAGFITWVNRIVRVRERVPGLPGIWASVWRVKRTSNAYDFPLAAKQIPIIDDKGQKELGTLNTDSFLSTLEGLDPKSSLGSMLLSFGKSLGAIEKDWQPTNA